MVLPPLVHFLSDWLLGAIGSLIGGGGQVGLYSFCLLPGGMADHIAG